MIYENQSITKKYLLKDVLVIINKECLRFFSTVHFDLIVGTDFNFKTLSFMLITCLNYNKRNR